MSDREVDQTRVRQRTVGEIVPNGEKSSSKDNAVVDSETQTELPELTLKNVLIDLLQVPIKLLLSPLSFEVVVIPLWIFESLLLKYIIASVPYTEIDYSTYMQQAGLFWDQGERDYYKIKGDTGAVVYPGGHLWLYSLMKWITSQEEDQLATSAKPKSIAKALAGKKFYDAIVGEDQTGGVVENIVEKAADRLEKGLFNGIDGMQNVVAGQNVFRWLYLFTFTIVIIGYWLLNTKMPSGGSGIDFIDREVRAESPSSSKRLWGFAPYMLIILCCSKRLHSIYVLRMFNDCFVTMFMALSWVSILAAINVKRDSHRILQQREEQQPEAQADERNASGMLLYLCMFASVIFYSLALSVKMSALLYLPGYVIVMYMLCSESLSQLLLVAFVGLEVQVAVNWPFIGQDWETAQHFFSQAFDFGRVFLYKWTVNWRFVPEHTFLSRGFHLTLLALQVFAILLLTCKVYLNQKFTGKPLYQTVVGDGLLAPFAETLSAQNVILSDSAEVFATFCLFSSNLAGILFARSLHYQFLAWYLWTWPFMLQMTQLPPVAVITLAAAHEWCWNVFPQTPTASLTLVAILCLVAVLSARQALSTAFSV